ncbi:MAG: ATP-grasp fold domain protein DUF201-type, partial [Solirubrobacterales bacterium]|nr:ATP-grasp fold domain protein DUF201-type [Solirubrobacterales bacterium]
MGKFGLVDLEAVSAITAPLPTRSPVRTRTPVRRVLVTDAENRSALAAIRSLDAIGFAVTAAARTPLAVGQWSRSCARRLSLPLARADTDGFVEGIAAALRSDPHALLLPCSDASLLAVSAARELLEPLLGAGLGLPSHDVVVACLDRRHVHRAGASAGLPAPATVECSGVEAAERAARELGPPVIVKPVRYERRGNGTIQRENSRLAPDLDRLRRIVPLYGEHCLIQRYQPGTTYSCGGMAVNGELAGVCLSRYLRTWPVASGNAAFSETVPADPRLTAQVGALVRELEWEGLFELEVIRRPDGGFAAIDFNPRVYGSMALSSAAGVDLTALWAAWATGGRMPAAMRTAAPGLTYRWEEADLRNLLWLARNGRRRDAARVLRPVRGTVHPVGRADDPAP